MNVELTEHLNRKALRLLSHVGKMDNASVVKQIYESSMDERLNAGKSKKA